MRSVITLSAFSNCIHLILMSISSDAFFILFIYVNEYEFKL